MSNLDVGMLPGLLAPTELGHTLALPLGAFLLLAVLLWTGCVRQRMLVNILAFGMMMPLMQLCLAAVAAHLLAGQLVLTLTNMMPAWPTL